MKQLKFNRVTGVLFVILVLAGCSAPREIADMQLSMPDLGHTKSGNYFGAASTKMVKAEVAVSIRNHRIKNIELINHETGVGKKAEVLTDSVISYQTVELDVISGATVSSKIILKAIENAVNKSIIENK